MPAARPSHRRGAGGFTLAEMLVAISVLSLMLVGLATATNLVTQAWLNSVGAIDNFGKARVTLGLMDRDVQMMVMRRDLAAFVDSAGSNPACAFYSNVQSYTGSAASMDTRTISLLQYQLHQDATGSYLQRLSYGSNFSGIPLSIGTPGKLPQLSNANVRTETLSSGVVAFKWQFVDGTGTILNPPFSLAAAPTSPTPFWFDFASPGAAYNPRVVIVSVVVMNDSAYRLAKSAGVLNTVISCFPTTAPSSPYQTYSQAWNGALNQPSTAFLALPTAVRSGIQVFERRIPLPLTTPSN